MISSCPVPVPVSWCRGHSKLVLLIKVLLLRYSAAGWPGPWPLRPHLDFGATGAPTFNLGVYLGGSTFSLPFTRQVQSLALHYEQLCRPCQVWIQIWSWGSLICFSKACILDFFTGEYAGDSGFDISGLAAHTHCLPVLHGYCGGIAGFVAARWCGLTTQQVIVTGEGKFTEDTIIMCVSHTGVHSVIMACHSP